MIKDIICVVCPKSCKIKIDANQNILNSKDCCIRGEKYAIEELIDPRRIFTSTVLVDNGNIKKVPVRTSKPIKKNDWKKAIKLTKDLKVEAPIKFKEVLIKNFLENGIDLIATREISEKNFNMNKKI